MFKIGSEKHLKNQSFADQLHLCLILISNYGEDFTHGFDTQN